jgi:hypothetical protein
VAEPTAEELTEAIALAIKADAPRDVDLLLRALARLDPHQAEAVCSTIKMGIYLARIEEATDA